MTAPRHWWPQQELGWTDTHDRPEPEQTTIFDHMEDA